MGDEHKEVHYALFPKTINYKHVSDGVRLTTTGVIMQIARSPNLVSSDFRASMAEKWQKSNTKNGGTLYGKTFIPFGKEGDMGDAIMTNLIQWQKKSWQKQNSRSSTTLATLTKLLKL
jgi:hypothetical protein